MCIHCIRTISLSLALSLSNTHQNTPKLMLSVSEAGRILHMYAQKQHRCSQGHRGRNMPAGLWTWSWEESRLPFLSNKLNCYASELWRSNWSGEKPHSFAHARLSHFRVWYFHYKRIGEGSPRPLSETTVFGSCSGTVVKVNSWRHSPLLLSLE